MAKRGRWLTAGILFLAMPGAWGESVRIAPDHIAGGKTAWILVHANPGVNVHVDAVSGTECGGVAPSDQPTNAQGEAKFVFTATADPPVTCHSTWKVLIAHSTDAQPVTEANGTVVTRDITVDPPEQIGLNTMDATTALTIILLASFAIDRLVKLLMALLPPVTGVKARDAEAAAQRERLVYIALAASMGLLLGYFGKIRLLAGLGFSTNVWLNALVTALILTAGSDAISALLKKMGGSAPGESEAKPLVVQGDLTLHREGAVKATTSSAVKS